MPSYEVAKMKREIMLEHVDRFGKSAAEIFADFRSDYGSYGERQCWYVLTWLIGAGCVAFKGTANSGRVYTRVKGARVGSTVIKIYSCSKCGMEHTTTRAHPDHAHALARAGGSGSLAAYGRYMRQSWYQRVGSGMRRSRRLARPPESTRAEMSTLGQPGADLG